MNDTTSIGLIGHQWFGGKCIRCSALFSSKEQECDGGILVLKDAEAWKLYEQTHASNCVGILPLFDIQHALDDVNDRDP